MGVAAGAHGGVDLLAFESADQANPRPVVKGVAQALIASSAHKYDLLFAALVGDGRGSAIASQGVIISFRDGLRSLAEHRGGDFSSQPRQGQKDSGVTMLRLAIGRCGELFQ
jgi:hypothetical protein